MQETLTILSDKDTTFRLHKCENGYTLYLENDNWPRFPSRVFDCRLDNIDYLLVEMAQEVRANGWVR